MKLQAPKVLAFIFAISISLNGLLVYTVRKPHGELRHATKSLQFGTARGYVDPPLLFAELQAANWPNGLIVAVLSSALQAQVDGEMPNGTQKPTRWRPIVREAPEMKKARYDLSKRNYSAWFTSIKELPITAEWREPGYEALSTKDYQRLRELEESFSGKLEESLSDPARNGPIRAAFEAEVRNILSTTDAKSYLRRYSAGAIRVQNTLLRIEVTQAEYDRLVDAAIELEKLRSSPDPYRKSVDTEVAGVFRLYAAVLGAERFLKIIDSLDPLAASADRVFLADGANQSERVSMFFLCNDEATKIRQQNPFRASTFAAESYIRIMTASRMTKEGESSFRKTALGAMLTSLGGRQPERRS